jgi:hypothetical protein
LIHSLRGKSTKDYNEPKFHDAFNTSSKRRLARSSSRTLKFLNVYGQELEHALAVKGETKKLEACKKLLTYDEFIQESPFLAHKTPPARVKLQKKALLLRKFECYGRCRDYWARELKVLKVQAWQILESGPVLDPRFTDRN